MSKKVMKLIDRSTGLMECSVCGSRHYGNVRAESNGQYYRGSWQCVEGCKLPEKAAEPVATR